VWELFTQPAPYPERSKIFISKQATRFEPIQQLAAITEPT
jgi:hypothetical protein